MKFFSSRREELEGMPDVELRARIRFYESHKTLLFIERLSGMIFEGAPTRGQYNLARKILSEREQYTHQNPL